MTESPFSDPLQHTGAQKSGAGLSWLALLVAVLALAASSWQWWRSENSGLDEQQAAAAAQRDQQMQQLEVRAGALQSQVDGMDAPATAARIAALEQDATAQKELRASVQTFQVESAALARSLQASIEGDQARIAGLELRIADLARRQLDSAAELNLAELDFVLRLAQERFQLFGDSRGADRALTLADQHLASLDNPVFIGLRREITSARERLAAMEQPDIVALNNDLEEIQSGLATLTFKGEVPAASGSSSEAPSEASPETDGWWENLKAALGGLVTVRRDSELEAVAPVLADQETIRQNAWLQLDLARLAVMRRDQPAYTAALGHCSATMQRWFEPSDAHVTALMQTLARLQATNIDPELPDISAPWTTLQAMRAGGLLTPPAPPSSELQSPEPDEGGQ